MLGITVEEVGKGVALRQFLDLGRAHVQSSQGRGGEWLLAGQRKRLASRPQADSTLFLARRAGRPVARLAVHLAGDGPQSNERGRFGFFAADDPDQVDATVALLDRAATWLSERNCSTVVGPLSWRADQEAGVLVAGHDQPAVTGRAWTPVWYVDLLEKAGLEPLEEMRSFRLPAAALTAVGPDLVPLSPARLAVPDDLTAYADPALLLAGPDETAIVAVPDVVGGLAKDHPRGAWALARKARQRAWDGCVILALHGPESSLVPALCAAAGRAGYQWVLSPWAPDSTPPVMVHRMYQGDVARLKFCVNG